MKELSLSRRNEFASIVSTLLNTAKCCKSPIRCKAPECGKTLHTLLHLSRPSHERNVAHQDNNIEAAVVPAVPLASPDCEGAPLSVSATATMVESSEILLQIIPLKVIGDKGKSITTYGLVDSGSDVTMIDPSLIDQLEIQGEANHLFLSTVNQR